MKVIPEAAPQAEWVSECPSNADQKQGLLFFSTCECTIFKGTKVVNDLDRCLRFFLAIILYF